MFDERSNETLVLLTLAGDSVAYEALVKKYEKAAYASAYAVTHAHHLAQDAAQDAFVGAWMKLNTLKDPSKFGSWVCQIAGNCAKNTLARFHAFLPMEDVEWSASSEEAPEDELIASEQQKEIRETVARLPERVRKVIELHYFSDLPIEKIAEKMGITVGTVKSQLFEGRRRLRKELSAMNENIDDTLTEKVMKKVEELKLWQLKNDKTGFEKVYEEVLSAVEALPESEKKHRALADVLLRGYWWLPGKANDELLARVKNSALLGGNDEAMIFLLQKEDSKFYGKQRIEFMRDVQIPTLEKAGLSGALTHEWYSLASEYYEEGEAEKGKEAFLRAEQIGKNDDPCKYLAPAGLRVWEKKLAEYKDEIIGRFCVRASLTEIRFVDRQPRRFGEELSNAEGYFCPVFPWGSPWFNASQSDGRFYDEKLAVGETAKGSDGTALSRLPDETVTTPSGVFENCRLFEIKGADKAYTFSAWYKDGTGLIKLACKTLGISDAIQLSSYTVTGGTGLFPIAVGNRWSYVGTRSDEYVQSRWDSEIVYANGEKAFIRTEEEAHRLKFDENSLPDMLQQISQDYFKYVGKWEGRIVDVSAAAARAEELAVTPLEKAHAKAACSVVRRIIDTAEEINPQRKASGHWNFFQYHYLYRKNGRIGCTEYDGRYCFEWKCTDPGPEELLLYNDIYGIFADGAGCLWNDEWQQGYSAKKALSYAGGAVNTELSVSDGGKIETESGIFEKTLKVTLETIGFDDGWDYRGVKKDYWFAEETGIVRAAFYLEDGRTVTYELSSYEGTGEGFFPAADGMRRFYRAVDLTDGCVGSADYLYVRDGDRIVLFSDRCGIRELGPKITKYSYVDGEQEVDRLLEKHKWVEARQQFDVNTFRTFAHVLTRDLYCLTGREDKASEWAKERLKILESFAVNGEIPPAWKGLYARATFYASIPTLGMRKLDGRSLDEGFELLFRSFDLFEEWLQIPDGTELDTGNELIFGGIKLYKGKSYMKTPDGTKLPLDNPYAFIPDPETPYYGLTAERGWEWFNPAREDPRFKEAIRRAKALKEKYAE